MFLTRTLALLLSLCVVAPAWADSITPVQRGLLRNSEASASGANATITITGVSGLGVHIYSVGAHCVGWAGAGIQIFDGVTGIWSTGTGAIGASHTQINFVTPLTISRGSTATITLSTCGTSTLGTVNVQADQY